MSLVVAKHTLSPVAITYSIVVQYIPGGTCGRDMACLVDDLQNSHVVDGSPIDKSARSDRKCEGVASTQASHGVERKLWVGLTTNSVYRDVSRPQIA